MRRALPILVATVAAIALLAGFHTTPASVQAVTAAPPPPTTAPPSGAPPDPTTSAPTTSSSAATGRRAVDGTDVPTRFGDVQVRAVLEGSRLIDVEALRLPFDHPRSQSISDQAGPWLHDEAIQAQSADIDTIGGATYTSVAYRRSLQAALDRAGLH